MPAKRAKRAIIHESSDPTTQMPGQWHFASSPHAWNTGHTYPMAPDQHQYYQGDRYQCKMEPSLYDHGSLSSRKRQMTSLYSGTHLCMPQSLCGKDLLCEAFENGIENKLSIKIIGNEGLLKGFLGGTGAVPPLANVGVLDWLKHRYYGWKFYVIIQHPFPLEQQAAPSMVTLLKDILGGAGAVPSLVNVR
uniref:Uncharacterized protein n=1 Tax=Romanomermis culicivorax TaxID=13658 RepID=A0A915KBN6_ROMCU